MPETPPAEVEVVEHIAEGRDIFTLRLRFTDPAQRTNWRFAPGQFDMLYLPGVGEVPISIASDVDERESLAHTVRAVGRVTRALAQLRPGDRLGLRGPFGQGWPLDAAGGRDLLVITGGLGCAPAVSVIRHVMRRRSHYGRLTILQGVRHSDDLLWRAQYEAWAQQPDTRVLLAADVAGPGWPGHQGLVTELLDRLPGGCAGALAMICGPEPMMTAVARALEQHGVAAEDIWLSLERNMHCGVGHCGHCQLGPLFVCRDGPVLPWPTLRPLLGIRGL
ncbi:FAD/NAD(P)-binding protein [endosymbiont of unidentified scaly snail isolate Monju]|uniref:FAD/NAD(P)-binding protein n=1 Tax=endosymbiont of unidentified scaly snail isolate Monju TaxID=1248727 RepID=UPI00038923BB|nr:FAD/NAD(P)-binding protein [endosymbiont of unidentified scaly snail isolate Monju]BAN68037.1 conserved hypothetical protein [endosymbiont of unidentified scaly snail isolate Monju]